MVTMAQYRSRGGGSSPGGQLIGGIGNALIQLLQFMESQEERKRDSEMVQAQLESLRQMMDIRSREQQRAEALQPGAERLQGAQVEAAEFANEQAQNREDKANRQADATLEQTEAATKASETAAAANQQQMENAATRLAMDLVGDEAEFVALDRVSDSEEWRSYLSDIDLASRVGQDGFVGAANPDEVVTSRLGQALWGGDEEAVRAAIMEELPGKIARLERGMRSSQYLRETYGGPALDQLIEQQITGAVLDVIEGLPPKFRDEAMEAAYAISTKSSGPVSNAFVGAIQGSEWGGMEIWEGLVSDSERILREAEVAQLGGIGGWFEDKYGVNYGEWRKKVEEYPALLEEVSGKIESGEAAGEAARLAVEAVMGADDRTLLIAQDAQIDGLESYTTPNQTGMFWGKPGEPIDQNTRRELLLEAEPVLDRLLGLFGGDYMVPLPEQAGAEQAGAQAPQVDQGYGPPASTLNIDPSTGLPWGAFTPEGAERAARGMDELRLIADRQRVSQAQSGMLDRYRQGVGASEAPRSLGPPDPNLVDVAGDPDPYGATPLDAMLDPTTFAALQQRAALDRERRSKEGPKSGGVAGQMVSTQRKLRESIPPDRYTDPHPPDLAWPPSQVPSGEAAQVESYRAGMRDALEMLMSQGGPQGAAQQSYPQQGTMPPPQFDPYQMLMGLWGR